MNEIIKSIVLSTRVRLARNFKGYPFPSKLGKIQAELICKKVTSALGGEYKAYSIKNLGEMESGTLMEKHLISKELLRSRYGSVIVSDDERVGIMVNEEDHVRIQVILPSYALYEAFIRADVIDDKISERADYAFDEKLGYLTACPTNLGTGLRASVMMFLPALSMTGTLNKIIKPFGSKITVRGVYGEGSKADGFVYQISNKRTLGTSERALCELVADTVEKLAFAEKEAREYLIKEKRIAVTDEIMRAYGIASNAYVLSAEEVKQYMALIKLGVYYGMIKVSNLSDIDELISAVQPYTLSALSNGEETKDEQSRAIFRARLVRETLKEIITNKE